MPRFKKIRNKFLITVLPTFTILFGAAVINAHYQLDKELRNNVKIEAEYLATKAAKDIENQLNSYYYLIKSNASLFAQFDIINKSERRKTLDSYIKRIAKENPEIYAVWTIWEPNVLDSSDKNFIATNLGMKEIGAFASTWKNTANGLAHNVAPPKGYLDEYYLTPKNTKKDCLLNPYHFAYSDNENEKIYETTIATPILKDGKFYGVIGVDISIQALCDTIAKIRPYADSGYAMLLANNGERIAHYAKEFIGKVYWEQSNLDSLQSKRVKESVTHGKQFSVQKTSLVTGLETYQFFAPVHIGNASKPWSVGLVIPMKKINSQINQNIFYSLVVGILGIIFGSFIIILISRRITKPLEELIGVADRIAKGDLTARAKVLTNDEAGELSVAFNEMAHEMSESLNKLNESAEKFALAQQAANFSAWEIKDSKVDWFPSINYIFNDTSAPSIDTLNDFFNKFHIDDKKRLERNFNILDELNSVYYDELRYILSDGSAKWIFLILSYLKHDGEVRYIGVALDINQRKAAEEERNMLAQSIAQTFEAIAIANLSDTIIYVNKSYEKLTGYTLNEIQGNNFPFYFDFVDGVSLKNKISKQLALKKEWSGLINRKNKSNETIISDCLILPILNSSGTPTHILCVIRDVTEKLKIEEKIKQTQKMDAIGALAGGIAHDFNNILTAIISSSEISLLTDDNDRKNEFTNNILKAANRAKDLTKQILTFSRMKEHEKSLVDAKSILKEAHTFLKQTIPVNFQLSFTYCSEKANIIADSTQILQVIMNLCTNAYFAIKDSGSKIDVFIEIAEIDDNLSNRFIKLKPGKYVRISVADDGYGIPKELHSKIFDPFFTTKKIGEGTGLGLSVAQGIIDSHNGEITFYSEVGKGTIFHIYLPYYQLDGVIEINQENEAKTIRDGSILIVDDEELIVENFALLLENEGYRVSKYTNSARAWQYFQEHNNDFDCAIIDQIMPDMTGIELVSKIRDVNASMPIIVCSGFSENISYDNYKDYNVQQFLMKPVLRRDLLGSVAKIISESKESI